MLNYYIAQDLGHSSFERISCPSKAGSVLDERRQVKGQGGRFPTVVPVMDSDQEGRRPWLTPGMVQLTVT